MVLGILIKILFGCRGSNVKRKPKIEGMKDSGKREKFSTGAIRDSGEKPRPELISPYAILREGEWMRKGAEKYGEGNWQKGMPFIRTIGSLLRHTLYYALGDNSEDHLAAIRTNAGFLIHFEELIKLGKLPQKLDDRHKRIKDE
jgi:hypothetical protein